MEWSDEGVIIGTRRQGEHNIILDVLTQKHGRHLGLVRGGASQKKRPILQKGNHVALTWRARLDEHLGSFQVEPIKMRSAVLMENKYAVYALGLLCQMLTFLPERDPHNELYPMVERLIQTLTYQDNNQLTLEWMKAYALFELIFLEILGFPLDLQKCAATGQTQGLYYVSPKTGRAVCKEAGRPYHNKLFLLPSFFTLISMKGESDNILNNMQVEPENTHVNADHSLIENLASAFKLTGYFLQRNIFEPHAKELPFEREKLIAYLKCYT